MQFYRADGTPIHEGCRNTRGCRFIHPWQKGWKDLQPYKAPVRCMVRRLSVLCALRSLALSTSTPMVTQSMGVAQPLKIAALLTLVTGIGTSHKRQSVAPLNKACLLCP